MMNLVALSLAFSSLLVAQGDHTEDHVMVTEGRRVIVIETYDEKAVPISHHHQNSLGGPGDGDKIGNAIGTAEDKVYDATQGIVSESKEKAEDAYTRVKETATEATASVGDVYDEAKDTASRRAHKAKEKAEDVYEKARDTASRLADEAKDSIEDAYEKASRKTPDAKQAAKESLTKAKDASKNAAASMCEKIEAGSGKLTGIAKIMFCKLYRFMASMQRTVDRLTAMINLLGFAVAYGTSVWVTFLSGYVLATVLPRHQFGLVQSKLYPVYFRAMAASVTMALLGHLLANRNRLSTDNAEMSQGFNLLACLLLVMLNSQYLEPLATKAMFERFKLEKEEARGRVGANAESRKHEGRQRVTDYPVATPIPTAAEAELPRPEGENRDREVDENRSRMAITSKRLKRLNFYSSLANLLSLMGLSWHLVYLGQCFHSSCQVT